MFAYSGKFLLPTSWGMPNIGRTETEAMLAGVGRNHPNDHFLQIPRVDNVARCYVCELVPGLKNAMLDFTGVYNCAPVFYPIHKQVNFASSSPRPGPLRALRFWPREAIQKWPSSYSQLSVPVPQRPFGVLRTRTVWTEYVFGAGGNFLPGWEEKLKQMDIYLQENPWKLPSGELTVCN